MSGRRYVLRPVDPGDVTDKDSIWCQVDRSAAWEIVESLLSGLRCNGDQPMQIYLPGKLVQLEDTEHRPDTPGSLPKKPWYQGPCPNHPEGSACKCIW